MNTTQDVRHRRLAAYSSVAGVWALCSCFLALGQQPAEVRTRESRVQQFVREIQSNDAKVRRRAISVTLRQIGPEHKNDAPLIMNKLQEEDGYVRRGLIKALTRIGRAALPTLVAAVDNNREQRARLAAIVVLGNLPDGHETSMPCLLRALSDDAPAIRRASILSIRRINGAPEASISKQASRRLAELLQDEDPDVVQAVLLVLGEIGPTAKEAIPRVVSMTTSDNRLTRAFAEQALRNMAPQRASELFGKPFDAVRKRLGENKKSRVGEQDWPQLGGSRYRNNTPAGRNIAATWNIGGFDRKTGRWLSENASNIKWVAQLGSQSYGSPVAANGKIYVGTNNAAAYLNRYSSRVDLGCLLCFRASDGKFLWQHSSEKLPTGRVHDWPLQGICSSPAIEGDRLWFVTNRGEVACLDTEGFQDGQDDGPELGTWAHLFEVAATRRKADGTFVSTELLAGIANGNLSPKLRAQFAASRVKLPERPKVTVVEPRRRWEVEAVVDGDRRTYRLAVKGGKLVSEFQLTPSAIGEADVVWKFDMMKELGVSQHNMATCAPTIWGEVLFICTSNGVNESHLTIPAPQAPSFIALNKRSGKVLWTDNSPGENILHGQWSCPAAGVFDGVPQVIFAGGDGWLYSFRADRWKDGKPELVWKFDCNPKASKWILGGRGTRNNLIAIPVIYDGLVYAAVGQDPEHGEGDGHLWCIDPTRRGDVSSELVVDASGKAVPHRRLQAATEWRAFTLRSVSWRGLDEGIVTDRLRGEFAKAGSGLPKQVEVKVVAKGVRWLITATTEGKTKRFRLRGLRNRGGTQSLTVEERTNERVIPNPNSAAVWHYSQFDLDGNGDIEFEEEFHRTIGSPAIKNELLFITDFSGLVHCLNAKTGMPYWTCDLLAQCWSTPLIVEDKVYVGDEDGDMAIFKLSPDPADSTADGFPKVEVDMGNSIYQTPIVVGSVLYVSTRTHLFAIESEGGE